MALEPLVAAPSLTRVAPEKAPAVVLPSRSSLDADPRPLPVCLLPVPAQCVRQGTLEAGPSEAISKPSKHDILHVSGLAAGVAAPAVPEDPKKVAALLRLIEPGQRLGGLSDFAKAFCTEALCVRLLRKYNGDLHRSTSKLEAVLRWRERNERLLSSHRFQEASDLRVIGFDVAGRPLLYQCARNQLLQNSKGLDQYVVRMVQAIDMMPPGVSTMTHIWDMHGMRMLLNLNPNAVLQLLSVLEGYFAERMHELIIVDVPQVAQFLVEAIWPAVPERTRKKVFFLSAKDALLHLKESCAPALTAQIGALVERNRDPACSLEERRSDWKQVDVSEVPNPLMGS